MRSLTLSLVFAACALTGYTAEPNPAATTAPGNIKLPMSFEVNQGQLAPEVQFTSRGSGYSLFLTPTEAVLALGRFEARGPHKAHGTDVIRMRVSGANPAVQPAGVDRFPGIANYFLGNDPTKWRTRIPTYAKVRYNGIYPGIDLVYYGNQRQLEYDFIVAPGADEKAIRLQFAGAQRLNLAQNGDLTIRAANGQVALHKPEIYQQIDGRRRSVRGAFRLLHANQVVFTVGRYDRSRPLVIDPVLEYSTYLGGNAGDYPKAIAVDASGNAYIAGYTHSTDFPVTSGAFQSHSLGYGTPFVAKLNSAGTALVYSTYLGGSAGDAANAIAVDSAGDAFVAGQTWAHDFPITPGAFQTTIDRFQSAFITKLSPDGSALVYSTYLGGDFGYNQVRAIALDEAGNAYVAGQTTSNSFPTTKGALQE